MMKRISFSFIFFLLVFSSVPSFAETISIDEARAIPIQHNGRVKPLDSFARQTLKLVAGKESWNKKSALETLFWMLADIQKIGGVEWIRVDYVPLKTYLGLSETKHFFSLEEIEPAIDKIETLVKNAKEKRDKDERPAKIEQKSELLYNRIHAVSALSHGESIAVLPPIPGQNEWRSPYQVPGRDSEDFQNLVSLFAEGSSKFKISAVDWSLRVLGTRASASHLEVEVIYSRYKPFEFAAILYLLAFLSFVFSKKNKILSSFAPYLAISAFLFHTLGLAARVYVLSRPPVSNMYESMIFMNWAVVLFAFLFSWIKKNTLSLSVGSILSAAIMLYANLLPIDSSLDVLVPVLRSNYWLSIHVMTVVSSYGAFGLAMALGHRHLFLSAFGKFTPQNKEDSAELMHRVIQLGVILIGTGTFLGGVWANESWGRFWGWDPKETWALITFLGYLIIVHLRYAKRLGDFGMAVGSILGFLLVLMTWYGVNFVLGRGLHSYGAGTGGINWIIYYLIFEALFLGLIFLKLKKP